MPIMLIMLILSLSLSVVESRALLVRDAPTLRSHTKPKPLLALGHFVRSLARSLAGVPSLRYQDFLPFFLTYLLTDLATQKL
jgi:hypothetical protein